MALSDSYDRRREGRWTLLVRPQSWSAELWAEIRERIGAAPADKHPQTSRVAGSYYLKIYSPPRGTARIKDLLRDSKAFRALKQTDALLRLGFHVPAVVAAGEERAGRSLGRAFLLTHEIRAEPFPLVLRERFGCSLDRAAVREKRKWIAQFADEVRRLHRHGFVHGDLVASNIMVGDGPIFYFMDHDRTRCYPLWLPQRLWMRNLVQLDRFALPGVSLRDRLRFMRSYCGKMDYGFSRRLERRARRRYGPKRKMLPGPRGRASAVQTD